MDKDFEFERCMNKSFDIRLPGKGNSNSHGAKPVHLIITIITMIKWIRTSRMSITQFLSLTTGSEKERERERTKGRQGARDV